MKVFILDYVEELTHSYHSGGGLVVIAETLARAKDLCAMAVVTEYDYTDTASLKAVPPDEDWAKAKVLPLAGDADEAVHVFPDAGCC